eukprot:TRINITY_DN28856_c0_g1_i1.p1 TRINITY_DN28856_c0_g1~~TRINITY_DN28856_c0_g1_i1.p1  ORF type:complete len:958 (+),score=224.47 TRINITY_DN28856_c0_g1_i1:69-2876(+)
MPGSHGSKSGPVPVPVLVTATSLSSSGLASGSVPEGGRKQLRPRILVPAKALLVLAALLSVTSSFLGGWLMYSEGLRAIEDTVEEISATDTLVAAQRLFAAFKEVDTTSREYVTLFQHGNFSSLTDMQRQLYRAQWARLSAVDTLYSIGVTAVPLTNYRTNSSLVYQNLWWDPLTDPVYVERNNGSDRQYVNGEYIPVYWNHSSCDFSGGEAESYGLFCYRGFAIDPVTGYALREVYSWTGTQAAHFQDAGVEGDARRWVEQSEGWAENGATWWRAPDIWESEDGTPLVYSSFVRILPASGLPNMLLHFKVVVQTYISFYTWQEELSGLGSSATTVACFLDYGTQSQVLATSLAPVLVARGCKDFRAVEEHAGAHPCLVSLGMLSHTVQDAAVVLNRSAENTFQRADIRGGEHWMRRRVIFSKGPGDLLDDIHLLWMRPVSAVRDKVNRGLYIFVFFLVGAVLLQLAGLALQLLKIGAPLSSVARAMNYIDGLDLDPAEEGALKAVSSCLAVTEITAVVSSFITAVRVLREYKGFLPQACLQQTDSEDEEEVPSTHWGSRRRPERSESGFVSDLQSSDYGRVPSLTGSVLQHVLDFNNAPVPTDLSVCSSDTASNQSPAQPPILPDFGADRPDRHSPSLTRVFPQQFMRTGLRPTAERRVVSILVCNIRALHRRTQVQQRDDLRILATAVGEAHRTKGVLDGIVGDRARCSWNAIKTVIRHRSRAAVSAAELWVSAESGKAPTLTLAAASGDAVCGAFGDNRTRHHAIIGGVVSFVHVAERFVCGRARDGVNSAVCDGSLRKDNIEVQYRWHSVLLFQKFGRAPVPMWEVVGLIRRRVESTEEWMYELQRAEDQAPFKAYNAAAELAHRGDRAAAVKLLAQADDDDEHTSELLAALRNAGAAGALPTDPLLLADHGVSQVQAPPWDSKTEPRSSG